MADSFVTVDKTPQDVPRWMRVDRTIDRRYLEPRHQRAQRCAEGVLFLTSAEAAAHLRISVKTLRGNM
jgi:hypothetical protein